MENQLEIKNQENLIIRNKRDGWAKFGESAYHVETSLQLQASKVISDNSTIPENIHQVPIAETSLKALKQAKNETQEKRKSVTGILDKYSARLMESEKSFDEPIKKLESAIIVLKRNDEDVRREFEAKATAIKSEIERLTIAKAQRFSDIRIFINNTVSEMLQEALRSDVKPDEMEHWLTIKKEHFPVKMIEPADLKSSFGFFSNEEFLEIYDNHYLYSPSDFVSEFEKLADEKFSDYEVSLANKKQAIEKSKQEAAREEAAQVAQLETNKIMATLSSAATPTNVEVKTTKDLKRSFVVEMEENQGNALKILAAYSGNLALCNPKLRLTKWFSFTPAQAAMALGKVKTDDNSFAPAGIIFVETEKL